MTGRLPREDAATPAADRSARAAADGCRVRPAVRRPREATRKPARAPYRAATLALAVGTLLLPGPATAAPAPAPQAGRSTAQLLADLQHRYHDAERATESYNAAREKLTRQRATVRTLDGRLTRVRTALSNSRAEAGRLAREQYQGHSDISPYVRLLLSEDPQHALDQEHLLRRAADSRADLIRRLAGRQREAAALAQRARTALESQQKLAARQKRHRDEVQAGLKRVEALLASLSRRQITAVHRLERARQNEAQRALAATGALGTGHPGGSARGRAAVAFALRQVGKPYVWGAQGPGSYDCSGLTSRAWASAGVTVPRTSQQQWSGLPRVPLNALRPGDLVVYFPGATHVALYIGSGKVVQAPRPGTTVTVSPLASNPVLGAVRPG